MKLALLLAALVASVAPASAMTRAAAPQKFSIPFANSAPVGGAPGDATYPLPTGSQIGIKCGAASLTDGFPAQSMQPVSAGGCAPLGQDFNGILKQITQWNQQTQAGGVPVFDATFSANIGGYPEGSILSQAGAPYCYWISQVDNNGNNPDPNGNAGWTGVCPGGAVGGTSTGSANSQIIAATPFAASYTNVLGYTRLCWIPGFTNTGPLQINPNSLGLKTVAIRSSSGSLLGLTGGEVQINQAACVEWDGTQWELITSAAYASLVQPSQVLSGGASVVSFNNGTGSGGGTITVDCSKNPLQYVTNAGAFTVGAPPADGSCMLMITNGAAAGTVSSSGFSVGANVGDPIDTVNGHRFVLSIWRINGISSFISKALQ